MKKAHKSILWTSIIILFILIVLYFISIQFAKRPVFFYGTDCPHCKNVEAFISGNNITVKPSIEWREVSSDAGNQQVLARVAKLCGLKPNNQSVCSAGGSTSCSIGSIDIPVLYIENKCYVGDTAIIDYINLTWPGNAGVVRT